MNLRLVALLLAVGVIAAIALSPARRRGQDPVAGGIGTTSAVTAPLVDGEFQRGWPMTTEADGAVMWAEKRSIVQPWPNGKRSM